MGLIQFTSLPSIEEWKVFPAHQVVHEIARLHNAQLSVESTKGVSWLIHKSQLEKG